MRNPIFALLIFFAAMACSDQDAALQAFEETNAKVQIQFCERQCYQYLLNVNGKLYSINSIPEEFKTDQLPVKFTGRVTSKIVAINKPAPGDGPMLDFYAHEIEIDEIVKR